MRLNIIFSKENKYALRNKKCFETSPKYAVKVITQKLYYVLLYFLRMQKYEGFNFILFLHT